MYDEKSLIDAVKYLSFHLSNANENVNENILRACVFIADRYHVRMHGRTITSKDIDNKFLMPNSSTYVLEEEINLLEFSISDGEVNDDCFSRTDIEAFSYALSLVGEHKDLRLDLLGIDSYYNNGRLKVEIDAEELFQTKRQEYHYITEELLELNKEEYIRSREFYTIFAIPVREEGGLFVSQKKELKK